MALLRTIDAPGVEIREIDRSDYTQSLVGTKVLVPGFASKGEDLALTWINSKATLDDTYGKPTTEYESYFYKCLIMQFDFAWKRRYRNGFAFIYTMTGLSMRILISFKSFISFMQ